jgi:hypothetical protein
MNLHVTGDLIGIVGPVSEAALLSIDVGGRVTTTALAAIDGYHYSELTIAVGSSDLEAGVHRLWGGKNGFVAVGENGDQARAAR